MMVKKIRKPYFSGVQDIVLCIIREYILYGNQYIERTLIDQEAMNTTLGDFIREHYPGQEEETLRKKVDLALHNLQKKGDIKHYKDKKSHWTLTSMTSAPKKQQESCVALRHEYEIGCENCGEYSYSFSKEKTCPNCHSESIIRRIFRSYCPIRKKYVHEAEHQVGE